MEYRPSYFVADGYFPKDLSQFNEVICYKCSLDNVGATLESAL